MIANTNPYSSAPLPGQLPYAYPYGQQCVPIMTPTPQAVGLASSPVLAAGVFGLVLVGGSAMGTNLRKVREGEMTMAQALSNSMSTGMVGGIAAASAHVLFRNLSGGTFAKLAATVVTAAGVAYLLDNKQ